jgi:hypothetical protein
MTTTPTTPKDDREQAVAATEGSCPRCGAARAPGQEYCVECGLRLPAVDGTVPRLRRRWLRRFGWYPGDWIWTSLLTLLVAAAGATVAIVLTERESSEAGNTFVATQTVSVAEPTTSTPATTADTSTLPTPPEPTVTRATTPTKPSGPPPPPNGRTPWPRDRNGWTIVLISYPTANGRSVALATASRAARAGLPEVGVLDSGNFSSLHPGYYVVFSGIYGSSTRADAAVRTARASGFAGAYTRQISR